MHRYLTNLDYKAFEASETFHDLLDVALRIAERMPKPLVQISGPITTGGAGSPEANIERIKKAKQVLEDRGFNVFDYLVFEKELIRVQDKLYGNERYCIELLEIFFKGIFDSGHISTVFFLPDWQSSTGASWERKAVIERKLEIVEFPFEWLSEFSNSGTVHGE